MRQLLRRTFLIAVLLLIAAAIAYAFMPQPVEVEMAEVMRGPMQVTVDEEGKTRVRERYVVSAPLTGRLQRIALKEGDAIERASTVLAAIAPTDPTLLDPRARAEGEARVRRAQAAIQRIEALRLRAQANLQLTQVDYERISQAYEHNAASRHEFDQAATALHVAQQELRSEEFALDMAQYELEQAQAALLRSAPAKDNAPADVFELRSPVTGRVFRILQESEAIVQPGTPLVEIGDPNDLEIVIDVLSTDAVGIQPGAAVSIERWGGLNPLNGRVRLVEPSGFTKISALGVEEQRVNVIVDFVAPTEADASSQRNVTLGDNFRIEGRIVTWEDSDVVRAPTSALFRTGDQWSVFVVEAGRASVRDVRIGHRSALEAEILQGLEPGEVVVIHPSDRVTNGVRIRARDK